MSFTVKTRKVDGVIVVDMRGRLTTGEPQWLLRDTVEGLIKDGNTRFVFNVSNVSYVDSSGLGELAAIKFSFNKQNAQVNLLGVTKRVKDLLVVTRLAVVFDLFDEESKAVAALQPDRLPQAAGV